MALAGPVKGKIVFRDHYAGVGWTETIYVNEVADLVNAAKTLDVLVRARVALLANQITIDNVTVSVENNQQLGDIAFGISYPFEQSKLFQPVAPGGFATLSPDFPWTAQLVRLHAGTLYHRSIWLSGVPDDLTLDLQGQIIDPSWLAAYNKWANIVANGNFLIYAASKDGGDSPVTLVTGCDVAGQVLQLAANYASPTNLPVFVHGIKGRANPVGAVPLKLIRPTGRFGVISSVGNLLNLNRRANTDNFIYQSGGYVRPVVYKTFAITTATLGALRKKARGRPLGLARGRSVVRYRT